MIFQRIGSASAKTVFVSVVAFAPACAPLQLPAKTGGPTRSREGVEFAVDRQSCTENVDPDFSESDLVEEVVQLELRNATSTPLTVQRDAFRLILPDGQALQTLTWHAADPLPVDAGEARAFKLRFMARGGIGCQHEMKVDADAAVKMNGRAVALGSISFQPLPAQ